MRKINYMLVVMRDGEDVFQVEAETPFGAMQKGDLLRVDRVVNFAETGVQSHIVEIEHHFYSTNEQTLAQITRVTIA